MRKSLIFVAITISLFGCAIGAFNKTLQLGKDLPEGEKLVFGSISLSSDSGNSLINVIDLKTSQVILRDNIDERVEKFYWHLPPGEYAVMNYISHNVWTNITWTTRLFAKFTVDIDTEAQYIGNIYIDRKGGNSIVQDKYLEAVTIFNTDFPNFSYMPEKRITSLGVKR